MGTRDDLTPLMIPKCDGCQEPNDPDEMYPCEVCSGKFCTHCLSPQNDKVCQRCDDD